MGLPIFASATLPGSRQCTSTVGGPIEIYPDRHFMSIMGRRQPGILPTVEESCQELAALYQEVSPDSQPSYVPTMVLWPVSSGGRGVKGCAAPPG